MLNLFKRTPGRNTNWYCWYYTAANEQRAFSCKTSDKNEAKRYAREKLRILLQPTSIPPPPQQHPTEVQPPVTTRCLSDFMDEYLGVIKGGCTTKSCATIRDSFRQFIKFTGGSISLHTITPLQCEQFILNRQPSVHSARKHYGHLKSAFSKAVVWGYLSTNPFATFSRPKAPETEVDYFREWDFERLLRFLPATEWFERRLRTMVIVAYDTGLRLGELRHLRANAIDFMTGYLAVRNTQEFTTKSKRNRRIPLSDRARAVLQEQIGENARHELHAVRTSPYIFPNEHGHVMSETGITHLFKKGCRRAFPDREGLHFHSLRHSLGTRLARAGVSLHIIKQWMGHSSIKVTERYTHLNNLDLGPAINVLNRSL